MAPRSLNAATSISSYKKRILQSRAGIGEPRLEVTCVSVTTKIKVLERMCRKVTDICKAASSRLSPITVVPDNSLSLDGDILTVEMGIAINRNF